MIGYHSVPVIAVAMLKDIKGFDYEKAYQACKTQCHAGINFGTFCYKANGYIGRQMKHESVSKTLEYAYDDWCTSPYGG